MTFREWQQLGPLEAAHELCRRVRALPPAQQRAAFVAPPDEEALAAAFETVAQSGAALARAPYVLKDLFNVAGESMFAGSTFLPEVRPAPAADGALVSALRGHGAVRAGRTHLHEFAYGLTGENAHYGDVEHPRFPGHTSGGSSSGSAALVAAGVVPLGIGTDTGGSIRVPAAYCGLFGWRTTAHHPFIADAFPLAPSFDAAGWFTADATDMATAIRALVGETSGGAEPRGVFLETGELDEDVKRAFLPAARSIATEAGAECRRSWDDVMTGAADAFSVLQSTEAFEAHRAWFDERRAVYTPAVWERIDRGRNWTPAQRTAAEDRRAAVCAWWTDLFSRHDFLALPAAPTPALRKSEFTLANRQRTLALTAPASLAGLPVLTVPVRLPSGLSAGIQNVLPRAESSAVGWLLEQFR